MKENQTLKMELLKEFGNIEVPKTIDFCREAYKFLTEGEEQKAATPAPIVFNGSTPENGLYLIYADGHYCKYDKSCEKEGIKYIGIIHDGHPFSVALQDLGRYQLLRDDVECEDESDFYLPRECDALNDWECEKRTKRIQDLGTDIPIKEGEFIPALPMVAAMCYWAERGLNEALEFAGGQPLNMDSSYWSVTEHHSSYAWYVNFGSGNINYYNKYSGYVVRPVAAFIP